MSWLYSALVGAPPQEVTFRPGASSGVGIPSEPPPSYESTTSNGKQRPLSQAPPRPRPLDLPAINILRGKRVILASASPRRKQLLANIGLADIEIIPSTFAEDLDKSHYAPWEYVLETATSKCQEVYKREMDNEEKGEPTIVIAADTVVVSALGEVMEKPKNELDHLRMLKGLRDGAPHKVYTAVVGMSPLEESTFPGYALESHVEETIVSFDKMVTDDLLLSYVKTREGADKAGGYAIQGTGSILIEKIEGTHDNVVGMPCRGTLKLIEKILSGEEHADAADEELDDSGWGANM